MRVGEYDARFTACQWVRVPLAGRSEWSLRPPDPDNPAAGVDVDTDAAAVVRLCRAFSGWLAAHKRLHPKWHEDYRQRDPGGLPAHRRRPDERLWGVQLMALPDKPYMWCPLDSTEATALDWVTAYGPATGAVAVWRSLGPIHELAPAQGQG